MPPVKPPRAESREILEAILIEQRQTNQLLALLIEALADEADQQDEEAEPTTYLDGTPRS